MANSAEGVGQLLANSALMKGERELLRKRDEPPAETSAPAAARPSGEPIANNSKVVAAVLLTLLDERLLADAALAGRSNLAMSGSTEADASKRVAAKYAADGLIPGDDLIAPQPTVQPDLARAGNVPPIASPDLQSFMQRFVAVVAGRSANASAGDIGAGRGPRGNAPVSFGAGSLLRTAGFAAVLIWLIVLLAEWAAH